MVKGESRVEFFAGEGIGDDARFSGGDDDVAV